MSGKIRVWRTCCLKVWGGIFKKKKLLPPDYFTYKLLVNLQVAVKMFLFIYLIFRGVPPWGEMRMRASYKNVNRHLPMAKFGISWVRTGTTTGCR